MSATVGRTISRRQMGDGAGDLLGVHEPVPAPLRPYTEDGLAVGSPGRAPLFTPAFACFAMAVVMGPVASYCLVSRVAGY